MFFLFWLAIIFNYKVVSTKRFINDFFIPFLMRAASISDIANNSKGEMGSLLADFNPNNPEFQKKLHLEDPIPAKVKPKKNGLETISELGEDEEEFIPLPSGIAYRLVGREFVYELLRTNVFLQDYKGLFNVLKQVHTTTTGHRFIPQQLKLGVEPYAEKVLSKHIIELELLVHGQYYATTHNPKVLHGNQSKLINRHQAIRKAIVRDFAKEIAAVYSIDHLLQDNPHLRYYGYFEKLCQTKALACLSWLIHYANQQDDRKQKHNGRVKLYHRDEQSRLKPRYITGQRPTLIDGEDSIFEYDDSIFPPFGTKTSSPLREPYPLKDEVRFMRDQIRLKKLEKRTIMAAQYR